MNRQDFGDIYHALQTGTVQYSIFTNTITTFKSLIKFPPTI